MSTTASLRIPFNRPACVGNELEYMADVIRNGHASGDGPYSKRACTLLERALDTPKVLLTPSCTSALEMSALLLGIEPGDEVIIPAFTFVSTVNAFVLRGAKPVFIDIRPDTLNLDEEQFERLITPRTRAIVPVHYAGVGCEMDRILAVANAHGIAVVEDNAHGLFGSYKGKALGTFGCMATQSFHETKNITCGEGGALLVNDTALIERAEIIREKGTNRNRFFRGLVDKYTWVDLGSSYLLSDILSAYLYAQLEVWETVQAKRQNIWERYDAELRSWASENGVRQPLTPAGCVHPNHMYYLLLPSLADRQALIAHLKAQEIMAVFHYLPLHLSEMGRQFGGQVGDCPVTEDLSDRLLRLPMYFELSEPEQARVIDAITQFRFG